MAIPDDLSRTAEICVAGSVSLNLVDVDPPGDSVDANDVCPFQARVGHSGKLAMTDVTLEVTGVSGTLVSASNAGPWTSSIVVSRTTIPAGAIPDTANLYFRVPSSEERPAYTQLLKVHVGGCQCCAGAARRQQEGVRARESR